MHATCSRLVLVCKMINYTTKHRKYRLCPDHYGEISAKGNSLIVFVLLILELDLRYYLVIVQLNNICIFNIYYSKYLL